MTMLMSGTPGSEAPLLSMTQARLQEQIQLAVMGEMDMPGFHMQIQQRFQNQGGSGEPTPGAGSNPQGPGLMSPTNMPGTDMNQPTGTPGQYGPGPQMPDRTPQPGGGSGRMP